MKIRHLATFSASILTLPGLLLDWPAQGKGAQHQRKPPLSRELVHVTVARPHKRPHEAITLCK